MLKEVYATRHKANEAIRIKYLSEPKKNYKNKNGGKLCIYKIFIVIM